MSQSQKPKLKQNGKEQMQPPMQRAAERQIFGMSLPHFVSWTVATIASTTQNAESMPSVNSVNPRMMAQKFGAEMVSMAVG